jgi:caa(3)-type oxidase subunit IV
LNDALEPTPRSPGRDPVGEAAAAGQAPSAVRGYLLIGAVLALATVVEVQLPHLLAGTGSPLTAALLATAVFKAALVVLFYMHLKSDSRVYAGIVVLSLVLVAFFFALLTFGHLAP